MSFESVVWAMNDAATDGPLERLILIYLANNAHVDDSFQMLDEQFLADRAGVPTEAAIRAVDRMKNRGLIDVQAGIWFLGVPWLAGPALPPERTPKAPIDPADRAWIYARDGHQCLRCGGAELTIDHVIPESLGGKTERANFQTLCRSCNAWKGVRTGAEFDYRTEVPA